MDHGRGAGPGIDGAAELFGEPVFEGLAARLLAAADVGPQLLEREAAREGRVAGAEEPVLVGPPWRTPRRRVFERAGEALQTGSTRSVV
jgi:hypothetical protein